jgi:acyl-CoA synthetase (NDP forming)
MADWGRALFEPRRVALVGASAAPGKVGHVVLRNLLASWSGEVHPIHPTETEILGRPCRRSVSDVPGQVDLAVIVVPASAMPAVIEDCAAAGVGAAIIISGGFAEAGPAGRALQERVAAVARAGGIRIVGPNCFGVINVHGGLNASIGIGVPETGGVSLFSQSGAYGMAAFSRSKDGEIGFAKVIAPGNTMDLNEVDVLRYLGTDPRTRVIAMLLESIRDGAALVETARAITPRKPVIILKTGRGESGRRAATSHTAALAGDAAVATAALRQAGVRLVTDGLTLLDVAAALDRQPAPHGGRVAVVTNSGGTGVELADLLEAEGMTVPRLSAGLQARIRAHLPAHASTENPVDLTVDWERFPTMYGETIRALLDSGEVDALIPVLLQRSALIPEVTDRVIAEVTSARERGSTTPVHICWVGPQEAESNRRKLLAAGIPCAPWAARAARTLAGSRPLPVRAVPRSGSVLPVPTGADQDGWLPPEEALRLVAAAGVPVVPWRVVHSTEDAVVAAGELGYPAVLKAIRPDLIHKTEAGAVRLGLANAAVVRAAAHQLRRSLSSGALLVQHQASSGVELVIGAVHAPGFGSLVVAGLGGIWVEALDDVSMRLAPFGRAEATAMLDELRGRALLDGGRGGPPVDRRALAQMISGVSRWLARAPWLRELDINPLIATGDGFIAVDARIRVAIPD